MDTIAYTIGYGVIIYGVFWTINLIISKNKETTTKIIDVGMRRNELALRELYWSGISDEEKRAIRTFSMGYGFSGWHSIVTTEEEYLDSMKKLNQMSLYNAANSLLKAEGNPYKIENNQVVPAKGNTHYFS